MVKAEVRKECPVGLEFGLGLGVRFRVRGLHEAIYRVWEMAK